MYCGVLYAPPNVVMGQVVRFFDVSYSDSHARVLQVMHTTAHTSATVHKRKVGGSKSVLQRRREWEVVGGAQIGGDEERAAGPEGSLPDNVLGVSEERELLKGVVE